MQGSAALAQDLPAPQHALAALEHALECRGGLTGELRRERPLSQRRHRLGLVAQGVDVLGLLAGGSWAELCHGRGEGGLQLKRGLAGPAAVEVEPGAQDEGLTGVEALAAGENGGEALLWMEGLGAASPPNGVRRREREGRCS
jgi:hypothetical protein